MLIKIVNETQTIGSRVPAIQYQLITIIKHVHRIYLQEFLDHNNTAVFMYDVSATIHYFVLSNPRKYGAVNMLIRTHATPYQFYAIF